MGVREETAMVSADAIAQYTHARGIVLDAAQQRAAELLAMTSAHGYYLHGPVGRGKSMLAEAYLDVLARPAVRVHVSSFLQDVQAEKSRTGRTVVDALEDVIGEADVVLLDEFHVHDVADAIFLTEAVEFILSRGLLLIATSNYAPSDLFPDPMFHHRFVPAIALIESSLTVVDVDGGRDHRRTAGSRPERGFGAGRWIVDAAAVAAEPLASLVTPDGHRIATRAATAQRVVTAYDDLCERPLGIAQYRWLAAQFAAVEVVEMPDPASLSRNGAMRLANLVDVLHDQDVALTVRAAGDPERLRAAAYPPRDLERTLSRLALLTREA